MRPAAARHPAVLAAIAVAIATVVAILPSLSGAATATAHARTVERACASYPVPGRIAPAGTPIPASLRDRYAILRRPQGARDRIDLRAISSSLTATGLIASGTRFLGDAAYGGRIYLVPALHELSFPIAPARCLPANERALAHELAAGLRSQYRHLALCVVVISGNTGSPSCGAEPGAPDALLDTTGTPAFGLVPDGIPAVTLTYQATPPRTLAVHGNFFVIRDTRQIGVACGVQWLDGSGSILRTPTGCTLLSAETEPLLAYRSYATGLLHTDATEVAALADAIAAGNLAAARTAWLTAHLTWLAIGQDDGAYGAFGSLGGAIDATAAGNPLGTADPGFTGFHRVEYDLWTLSDLGAAARDTATLASLLDGLAASPVSEYLPLTATSIANWLLRPHEVLEDAIRDTLSGNDDYGSGTGAASIIADVGAVRTLLDELAPVANPIAPGLLGTARRELDALVGAAEQAQSGGAWTGIAALPARVREQIDADADAAAQTLAPFPDLLTSTGRNSGS